MERTNLSIRHDLLVNKKKAFLKKLGAHIKRVRIRRGYSQDRVVLEGGLSRATMSRIERGDVDPQAWTLARVAETIGVNLCELLDFKK